MANPETLLSTLGTLEIDLDNFVRFGKTSVAVGTLVQALKNASPVLLASYGIEPGIDYRRGRLGGLCSGLATQLESALSHVARHPIPEPLVEEIRKLRDMTHDLRRDTAGALAVKAPV